MEPVTTFRDAHKGETCLIIGNGPSLKDVPLEFLRKYPSFGSNRIWRLFQPSFYCCTDPLDVRKNRDVINAMPVPRFVRSGHNVQGYQIEVILQCRAAGWKQFTPDPTKPMYDGCTVTYIALELAYYMGFTTALMIGVDHSYSWKGKRFQPQYGDGHDKNHWAPDYHLPGEMWLPPNLPRNEHSYGLARAAYEADGRKIINLTQPTALSGDIIPQGRREDW